MPLVSRLEHRTLLLRSSCGKRLDFDLIVVWSSPSVVPISAPNMPEEFPLANSRINFLCGDVDAQFRAFLQTKEEEVAARLLMVSAAEAPAGILTLPPEVITIILNQLDGISVLRMSSVNKDLKFLYDEKHLWMYMLSKDFSVLPGRLRNFNSGPKYLYKSIWRIKIVRLKSHPTDHKGALDSNK